MGAGLPAIAVCQITMLSTDTPSSRASPLPQVFVRFSVVGCFRVLVHLTCRTVRYLVGAQCRSCFLTGLNRSGRTLLQSANPARLKALKVTS